MKKNASQYLCTECGDTFVKWMGKCPSCQSWNTLKEFKEPKKISAQEKTLNTGVDLRKKEADSVSVMQKSDRIKTGIFEVDRVLGGGFFPGSLTLFGGSPGIGKSTLSLQIFLDLMQKQKRKVFYFSGEESQEQVWDRAERLMADKEKCKKEEIGNIFSTNSLEDIIQTTQSHEPDFIVVDSIQMVGLENARLGNLSQIKINAEVLLKLAKTTNTTVFLIGHVTKSDEIAGPRVLEHIVDTTLQLEGERNSEIRILRSPKNRFGSTLEVGVFEMQSSGLKELKNPSEFFLAERAENSYGSVITVMREGARNFLIEIQALTVKTNFGLPRRTSHGVDLSKVHLLLAVISKFTPFPCDNYDAYVNITSGMKVQEPSADLAIVAAIISSRAKKEIPADTIILGEVGLSGEVRSVSSLESRLHEAEKLGFKKAIVPKVKSKTQTKTMEIKTVKTISECVRILFGSTK